MKTNGMPTCRQVTGISAGCRLGGLAIGIVVGAPSTAAAPDCSPDGVSATVSSVTESARQYLDAHPGASQAVMAAYGQSHDPAAVNFARLFHRAPAGVQPRARRLSADRRHRAVSTM